MRSLIDWLFNLESMNIGPESEVSVQLNQGLVGWQVFLAILGVVGFALWIYRTDGRGTTSPLIRFVLGTLRAGLIAMAILILTEPVLVATQVETRRSCVIVLVDDSYSMDLKFADASPDLRKKLQSAMTGMKVTLQNDAGTLETVSASAMEARHFKMLTRLNAVSNALQVPDDGGKAFFDRMKERHDVRFFAFSKEVSATDDQSAELDPAKLVSSQVRGGETRIGDALRRAIKEVRGQPLAGIVIVSDGRQNAGEDAVQAAQVYRTKHVPVFTVGVGDPSEPRDFEISFEGPEMILPDDQSEGTAMIRYKGYKEVPPFKVEMRSGDKIIATEDVKLGKPGEKTAVPLRFKEAKAGKYTYTIRIPEQEGEMRADNNVATYNVQVVDKKVRVLFVEGQDLPRWEYRYLKNALRRDHTTEVDALLAMTDPSDTERVTWFWDGTDGRAPLEHFPGSKKEINEYDVVLFGDVNPDIFTPNEITSIRDFVREGGGFMMIAGERYAPASYLRKKEWAEMLPVVPQPSAYQAPDGGWQDAWSIELSPEGQRVAWTHLDPDDRNNKEIWQNLPQLFWYYPVKKKKELATTLAVHPVDKDESGSKMPLIVTMPYGSGRTMFIGTDDMWRWRRGQGDRYHYRFYNQAIRNLSMAKRLGGQKRFFLGTDRNLVAIGDRVILNAIVKDENLKEVTQEKVTVHGKNPKGEDFTIELSRMKDRPGSYEGNMYPGAQGEFTIWLKDSGQPDIRQSEVTFKVEKPQMEFENPQLDEDFLRNVARAGGEGGEYVSIDQLRSIPPKIAPKEEKLERTTALDIWDKWWVFFLFTAMITAEWVLRKRVRLI